MTQSCTCVLKHNDYGYLLQADPNSKSMWCDSYIGETDDSALAKRVLKTCSVGSRCHIEGSFVGHGVFYWTRITKVNNP
jgi:hypothetical protein